MIQIQSQIGDSYKQTNTAVSMRFDGTDYDELTPTQTPTVSSGGLFSIELPEYYINLQMEITH